MMSSSTTNIPPQQGQVDDPQMIDDHHMTNNHHHYDGGNAVTIARGRWNLLREAILSCSKTTTTTNSSSSSSTTRLDHQYSSIHDFVGYQMIPSPVEVISYNDGHNNNNDDDDDDDDIIILKRIIQQQYDSVNSDSSSLYSIFKYTIPLSSVPYNVVNDAVIDRSSIHNNERFIHVYTREKSRYHHKSRITTIQELVCHHHDYKIDNTGNICVWDAERTLCWFLLCSTTLFGSTFCNAQQQQQQQRYDRPMWLWLCDNVSQPPSISSSTVSHCSSDSIQTNNIETKSDTITILELGCGMAGLAALSVAAAMNQLYFNHHTARQQIRPLQQSLHFHFYLTDGNIDCVRNNEINVEIMRNLNVLPPTAEPLMNHDVGIQIDCCQLLWSYDFPIPHHDKNNDSSSSSSTFCNDNSKSILVADITFISDCIHFEIWHGELLWTIVTHTRQRAILCQPNRTPSWHNFVAFIQYINDASPSSIDYTNNNNNNNNNNNTSLPQPNPLIQITEIESNALQEKHDHFIQEPYDSSHYNADKHRPRIFFLDILRTPTEKDRRCMMEYCVTNAMMRKQKKGEWTKLEGGQT